MKRFILIIVFLIAEPLLASAAPDCGALKSAQIADTTIDSVENALPPYRVTAPSSSAGGHDFTIEESFCRVRGTIRPAPTSDIKFELWLPTVWNGKFYQAGNGGPAGNIQYAPLVHVLAEGYAAASTDDGTSSPDHSVGWQSDPERMLDYRKRAVHLTALASKALTTAYYGRAPLHAYFQGGSKGGQEGLEEAQSYPEDFDGIIAFYPTIRGTYMTAYLFWAGQQMNRAPGAALDKSKLQLLHDAVLRQCLGQDGGVRNDGFLTYPPACRFDPRQLQCKGDDTTGCLTPEQVRTAEALYRGPVDPRSGRNLGLGLFRGSEAPFLGGVVHGWAGLDGTLIRALALENSVGKTALGKANWDYRTFSFDADLAKLTGSAESTGETWNADLSAFKARGGKLIVAHGWDDPIVPPRDTILYFERVAALQKISSGQHDDLRLAETRTFFRLFMVPGFGHGLSAGLEPRDPLPALAAWVEKGEAPAVLPAVQYEDGNPEKGIILNRDLCAWPEVSKAGPSGTFSCVRPRRGLEADISPNQP